MKQHKAMIVALIVICITAVVAGGGTRKNPYWGPASRIGVRAGGGSAPRHFTGARISSTHPVFYLACPRAGFWGG